MEKKVTKDMLIPDALQVHSAVEPLLLSVGMHCLGCPSHRFETLEQAAQVHGFDPDSLVGEINKYLEAHPE